MKQETTIPKTMRLIGILCSVSMICWGVLALGPNGRLWQVVCYGGIGVLGLIYTSRLKTKPQSSEYRESKSIFSEDSRAGFKTWKTSVSDAQNSISGSFETSSSLPGSSLEKNTEAKCRNCGKLLSDAQAAYMLNSPEYNEWCREGYCCLECFEKCQTQRGKA